MSMNNSAKKIKVILFDLDNTLLQTDSLEQFRKLGKEAKFEPY